MPNFMVDFALEWSNIRSCGFRGITQCAKTCITKVYKLNKTHSPFSKIKLCYDNIHHCLRQHIFSSPVINVIIVY